MSQAVVLLTASLALLVSACSSGSTGGAARTVTKTAGAPAGSSGSSSGSSAAASSTAPAATPVGMTTLNNDGATYGIGMPVIVFFKHSFTSAVDFQKATTVTVNGAPVIARWYFEPSSAGNGPVEGHLRPQTYWTPHSKVHVQFPPTGTPMGQGLALSSKLVSLDFSIGASNISTVDDSTHKITVMTDGKNYGTFPVSLGASRTPTFSGVKVIMEKYPTTCMHDTNNSYYECGIKWDQRLTYSGEYLHAAPWNLTNIANGVNSSNGCTNLRPADAIQLYNHFEVGDVVTYPNANGPAMTLGQGYGDWNVSWGEWQTGGYAPTS